MECNSNWSLESEEIVNILSLETSPDCVSAPSWKVWKEQRNFLLLQNCMVCLDSIHLFFYIQFLCIQGSHDTTWTYYRAIGISVLCINSVISRFTDDLISSSMQIVKDWSLRGYHIIAPMLRRNCFQAIESKIYLWDRSGKTAPLILKSPRWFRNTDQKLQRIWKESTEFHYFCWSANIHQANQWSPNS